ncbi:hypothetical protein MGG_16906 [Pyricularia oryzae 70-15]|uniref:Uncharacterized protein n=4 Tax=Pyricularia oryzae TaxID=318829 RepID=G4N039_PYRO7|nr:uncharacterized protein MGG_16906 [Pyricularia oryzae 70-15]EHA53074.1 hypothetical protein MGG_16906 [Pyricularia oryzae 70-15]ELQ44968.1 hypothetical protein OOU_Y34scaffold00033g33 [Pyricularia oryzae Y34]QBZ59705.1 hypothetical protein PoMZ_04668 [Pyricularia oryzae]
MGPAAQSCGKGVCPPPLCYKDCRFASLPCTERQAPSRVATSFRDSYHLD